MILEIASVSKPTDELWDRMWETCDYGTYYHSRHWATLWEKYAPEKHRAAPKLVTFTDGMKAILPLTITKRTRGLIETYESSPYNTYGGWISTDPLTARHANLLAAYLRGHPNMKWMTNPFEPITQSAVAGEGEATWTRFIELGQGLQSLNKKTRYAYHFALRSGLTLRSIRPEDLEAVNEIYADNHIQGEEQRTPFGPRLFSLLLQLEHADFLGAFHNDRLVATTVAFRSKRHIAVWLAFARSEFSLYKPLQFMDAGLIERYAKADFSWYDMHPSGDRPTIDQAKKLAGATQLTLNIIRNRTPAYRAAIWAHGLAGRFLPDRV